MKDEQPEQWTLREEFEEADLGDERRRKRLLEMADRMEAEPDAGFPTMMGSEAGLEGCYRFLNNPHFDYYDMLEPHVEQTSERAEAFDRVRAVHDQTTFICELEDQQEAAGELHTSERGFFGQFSLVLGGDGGHQPVGVSAVSTIFRDSDPSDESEPNRKLSGADYADQQDRESEWWMRHVRWTEGVLAESDTDVVHVCDAGFDSYRRCAAMEAREYTFVTRSRRRKVRLCGTQQRGWIGEIAQEIDATLERSVHLSRRRPASSPQRKQKYPARKGRKARLRIGMEKVELERPHYVSDECPETLTLNLVRVWEPDPPEGEEPVEWLLLTNQSTDGELSKSELVGRVVDDYQARWGIESYFKAFKTGCSYRERQLENRESLLKALAWTTPMAWLLMAMRGWSREHPDAEASIFLSERELKVLRHFAERDVPEDATLKKATLAVAGLGGHQRSNGPPGWQTLQKGLTKLRRFADGWDAALEHL